MPMRRLTMTSGSASCSHERRMSAGSVPAEMIAPHNLATARLSPSLNGRLGSISGRDCGAGPAACARDEGVASSHQLAPTRKDFTISRNRGTVNAAPLCSRPHAIGGAGIMFGDSPPGMQHEWCRLCFIARNVIAI